jgi:iron complex outermembrane receptor protein
MSCLFLTFNFLLFCLTIPTIAQEIHGIITNNSNPIPGITISSNTGKTTITDQDGKYTLLLTKGKHTLQISGIGFSTETEIVNLKAGEKLKLNVELKTASMSLEEVIFVGTRSTPRTRTQSALPVDQLDELNAKVLSSTGQQSFDKALQYRVPSFNTINSPVSDATTLLDPYEIRNLGPSRTLILINGKRKNLSSLVYVWSACGRGETGADLSAIPIAAIKRVEILRDGASAQYGSDAIAGVMNVILNDRFETSTLNINTGVTGKGDGANYGLSLNSGTNIGSKGFINYTIGLSQQEDATRPGLIDLKTEIATFGGDAVTNDAIQRYLTRYPTANNLNGTGATTAAKFEYNINIPIVDKVNFYSNAAYVFKNVQSNANFRPPYWRIDEGMLHVPIPGAADYTGSTYGSPGSDIQNDFLSDKAAGLYQGYLGYHPTMEGDLSDYNCTVGFNKINNGWKNDVSITVGGNKLVLAVNNTVNRSLRKASPTTFRPGGFAFNHVVGNMDFSKSVLKNLGVAFGTEVRKESYEIIGGDTASYSGQGSNSFPGTDRVNAGVFNRYNLGAYADASYDFTKILQLNGAIRGEKYSDFGNAFVYKLSSLIKLAKDKFVVRGSVSSGFKAPTLHQIYTQSTQASFIGGSIVSSGLFNNNSKQAFLLGIPKLKAEKANNFTLGVGYNPTQKLNLTLDFYDIRIKNRIVYSSSISSNDQGTELYNILRSADLVSIQFFINGISTHTSGLDLAGSYNGFRLGAGKMDVNIAANYTLTNKIVGKPNDPSAIARAGTTIMNPQIASLLTESRPRFKAVLGADYIFQRFSINFNNTLFGPTKFQDIDNGASYSSLGIPLNVSNPADPLNGRNAMMDLKQVFSTALVTDLTVNYELKKNVRIAVTINNIFNVLPSWELQALNTNGQKVLNNSDALNLLKGYLTFSGRYRTTGYNGSQFSQLGTIFAANLQIRF